MNLEMRECGHCFERKPVTDFYLKSKKGETPERRERVCKKCKPFARRSTLEGAIRSLPTRSPISSVESLEEAISFFLTLQKWRDQFIDGIGEVSNLVTPLFAFGDGNVGVLQLPEGKVMYVKLENAE